MSQYRFRWTSSYMGIIEYEVSGDGSPYRVELRREASDYEKSIYNHASPLADWERDVVAAIGVLRRCHGSDRAIPQAVVDANAWRVEERAKFQHQILSQPEKYGKVDINDPFLFPPLITARAGRYEVGTGWVITEAPDAAPSFGAAP